MNVAALELHDAGLLVVATVEKHGASEHLDQLGVRPLGQLSGHFLAGGLHVVEEPDLDQLPRFDLRSHGGQHRLRQAIFSDHDSRPQGNPEPSEVPSLLASQCGCIRRHVAISA